MEKLYDSLN